MQEARKSEIDEAFAAQQTNNLIVLGAGASIGAAKFPIENSWRQYISKMPSGENFFRDLFNEKKRGNRTVDRGFNLLGIMYGGLNELIVKAWDLDENREGWDPDEWTNVNIEDVFTFLDVGRHLYTPDSTYQKIFNLGRDYLEDFITTTLAIKSDGFHCEHLQEIVWDLKPQDSIISFNWDTIADFTLERSHSPLYEGYIDLMTAAKVRPRDFTDRAVLLKLHGSLNWLRCPNKDCELYEVPVLGQRKRKLLKFVERSRCRKCKNAHVNPLIVPPTSNKVIKRRTILHKLWQIARNKIPSSKRIFFIGYSFPPTDFYSQWLFRQIYFLPHPRPEIIIVNPETALKNGELNKRFDRIFKGCKIHRFTTLEKFTEKRRKFFAD